MTDAVRTFANGVYDAVFSPDGSKLYTAQGAYSVATGALLTSFSLPTGVNGMDVTPDGHYLLAVGSVAGPDTVSGNSSSRSISVYQVDLLTGVVTIRSQTVFDGTSVFFDIAALSNDKAVLAGTTYRYSGLSFGLPITYLDLATGAFSTGPSVTGSPAVITSAAGHAGTLIAGTNISDAPIATLDATGAITARHGDYADGVGGNNQGVQAISIAGDKIVQGLGLGGFKLYDSHLHFIADIDATLRQQMVTGSLIGVTFNSDGSRLYGLNATTDLVYEFSTADWHLIRAVPVGATVATSPVPTAFGDRLTISADDRYLSVIGTSKLQVIDLQHAASIDGTTGNDTLTGTDGPDAIFGLDGNDHLDGLAGPDTMIGGAGDDSYVIDDVGDIVIEAAGGGTDTITTSVDYALPDNVETMILAPGAIATLTGGSQGGHTLIGNERGTLIQGNINDTLIGGLGDDTLRGGGIATAVIHDTIAHSAITAPRLLPISGGFLTTGTLAIASADGKDTLAGISKVRFDDGDLYTANLPAIVYFYTDLVGRAPTSSELVAVAQAMQATLTPQQVRAGLITNGTVQPLIAARISDAYQIYGGRAATSDEVSFWTASLAGGGTYGAIRNAILHDPLGKAYVDAQITSAYQQWGGRAPTTAELAVWEDALNRNNDDFSVVKTAIVNDPLGQNYAAQVIAQTYLTYGGRAPIGNEVAVWQAAIRSGTSFDAVRQAILDDPLGQNHTIDIVTAVYRNMAGRLPTAQELADADAALHAGGTIATLRANVIGQPANGAYVDMTITQLYRDYGGRDPALQEKQFWTGFIVSGGEFTAMRTVILDDPLGQAHSAQVIDQLYRDYGGRPAESAEVAVWKSIVRGGQDFAYVRQAILNDPLGQTHTAAAVTALYQTYAGRAATAGEIMAANTMLLAGSDYTAVRTAVLNDATIHTYEIAQINAAYQTYGGRAASSDELSVWDGALKSGASYDTISDAILHDPLGRYYVDQQIIAAYQTYGGRAPTSGELTVWESALGTSGNYSVVRDAILHDPLGRYYVDQQITAAYQTYGGRAPTSGELTVWENALGTSGNYAIVKNAILGDPLGKTYVDAQINAAYRTYGGRAATSGELQVWENALNGDNHDFGIVRSAILNDPLGINNSTTQIAALYQRYFQRAPSADEQTVWHAIIRDGKDFDQFRDVLMSDSSSAATTTQLNGTIANDTFHFAAKPYLAISGFDAAHDVIDLQGLGFASIDPLDAAHARQIHAYDGTPDVLITLDAGHEILLHGVQLAQLSSADFLL